MRDQHGADKEDSPALKQTAMECERCFTGEEAKYRTYTDIIDMKVCAACADRARKLGIAVEDLDNGADGNNAAKNDDPKQKDRQPDFLDHTANN